MLVLMLELTTCVVTQGLMLEMVVWFPARSLHRVHVQGLSNQMTGLLGCSVYQNCTINCTILVHAISLKKYDSGKRTIVVTVSRFEWFLVARCFRCSLWRKPGCITVRLYLRIQTELMCQWHNCGLWIGKVQKSRCLCCFIHGLKPEREALNAQRSWVGLSYLGLAILRFTSWPM